MAFSQTMDDEEMFNVTFSVGSRASNFTSDIMLVQSFIWIIYLMNSTKPSLFKFNGDLSDLPNPNQDFRHIKKTERWIRKSQNDGSQNSIVKGDHDGPVDVLMDEYTPKTHSKY